MGLAFLGALIVGMSLGLLGSGGSIFTVPVLIFVLHRPDKLAIAESLAIVALIAFSGAFYYCMRSQVHWKSVLYFGLPGIVGAYAGAACTLFLTGSIQLILFALMMYVVSYMMLFESTSATENSVANTHATGMTAIQGFFVGCLTGLLGCGGGFLIVPALVFLSRLAMTMAIGTSLVIITLNATTGFIKQVISLHSLEMFVSWHTIILFSTVGIIGSFMGGYLSNKCSQNLLKRVFGVAIFLLGSFILFKKAFIA